MSTEQLAIDLERIERNTFNNFVAADSNAEIVKCLQAVCNISATATNIYLSGGVGYGKTHLLNAVCHSAIDCKQHSLYWSLKETPANLPEMVKQAKRSHIVCIDDIHIVAGNRQAEEVLFNLINHLRHQQIRFISAGLSSPKHTDYILPDLSSRLMWGGVYSLLPLSDSAKAYAIKLRLRDKGDELSDEVVKWLLFHYARDMHSLMKATQTLARESLHLSRRITVPLAKALLREDT